jgi:ATP-dependent RNA helicase DDX23/PRP28
MAPTRELAQQIEEETLKLACETNFDTVCVVGGQSIELQAFKLRGGVHIMVGTPGRIQDCLLNSLMVLNQCNYVVLDEADRMIDMGFEPQVVEVLDAMGGLLRIDNEDADASAEEQAAVARAAAITAATGGSGEAVRRAKAAAAMEAVAAASMAKREDGGVDSGGRLTGRTTAMFSATMLPEVERIAKKYLRDPVIVKIGDEEAGAKNKRIEQRVLMMSEGNKKRALVEQLRLALSGTDNARGRENRRGGSSSSSGVNHAAGGGHQDTDNGFDAEPGFDKTAGSRRHAREESEPDGQATGLSKVIVFCNLKKDVDSVCHFLEKDQGYKVGILHGGRSQDQREETLEYFKVS